MKISRFLNIQPGITALIGGGGKTTLMYRLSQELSAAGSVIVCTSAKILEPKELPVLTDGSEEEIVVTLKSRRVVCVGTKAVDGKLSAPAVSFDRLKQLAHYVIVEADGAHRLPIKAHAEYEPVIPDGTNKTVLIIGADAFGKSISDICHRPELFAAVAGADICSPVTPEIVGRVINAEGYGDCVYINKAEDDAAMAYARTLADIIDLPIMAGSLIREEYVCLR